MDQPPRGLSHEELLKQRAEVRRGLTRVNTALLVIVTIVICLAVTCIFAAYGARERAEEARQATARATEDLWKSYLAQATANRLGALMGRKASGEEIVTSAARIRASVELRSEAIAQMVLTDLKESHQEALAQSNNWLLLDPSQTRYATAQRDGMVEYRTWPDQQLLFKWQSTNPVVSSMVFSSDGRYLGVSSPGGGFQVIDVQKGSTTFCVPRLRAFDFSQDGKILAAATPDMVVHFFANDSGAETGRALTVGGVVNDLGLDPTGRKLAINTGKELQIWNWREQRKEEEFKHESPIVVMAWSEHYLAVGDGAGELEVWDLHSRKSKRLLAHKALVDNLFFNHKGDLLVSDSFDGSCRLWNPRTGNLITSTTKGFGTAFSLDDQRLVYSTKSSRSLAWGWWEVSRPRGFKSLDCSDGAESSVWQTDFSPDGHLLAIMKADGLRLYDFPQTELQTTASLRHGRSAYFLPDGKTLLTIGEDRLSFWPLENSNQPGSSVQLGKPATVRLPKTGHVDSGQMSFDRQRIALPLTDSEAALIDLRTSNQTVIFAGGDLPKEPAISPDGKWVVTGTFHGHGATVWDGVSGKKLLDLEDGNSNPVFSPDGTMLVLAGDKDYRILESGSWRLLHRIPSGSVSDLPGRAAFSRDGQVLAIVKERSLLELLEPRSGMVLARLAAPDLEIINDVNFNWDGTWLAASSADSVQLWELPAIRRQLAAIGLDWSDSGRERDSIGSSRKTAVAAELTGGSPATIVPAVAAVALVIFCAWFVLRRQRRLFGNYLQIDELVEQRNRELKVAQTELMHGQKMKALGTLAAGIAHDFNNLLSVIRMSNKLIGRQTDGNAELQENVAEVEQAVQQGKHIVASMLGSGGQKGEVNGNVSLPDLVEDTVGLLSRQFLSGITLDLELDRNCPGIPLPRARLEQILLNLVVNASEAMGGRGCLRIQVHSRPKPGICQVRAPRAATTYVELVVADTGCGIDREVMPRIFDPFFTTKVRGGGAGTGLGLAMVYTLAEQDDLGIGVETNPGKGATFRIAIGLPDRPAPASTV